MVRNWVNKVEESPRGNAMHGFVLVCAAASFFSCAAGAGFAQGPRASAGSDAGDSVDAREERDNRHIDPDAAAQFQRLDGSLRSIDWASESKNASQAIVRVFERNGWTDETHVFARDTAVKVAAIPPWDLNGRLQAISNAVKERYDLSQEVADRFRGTMLREVMGLILRNAGSITQTTTEAIQTRQASKPFTKEQVAQWCNMSTDFMKDGAQTAERLVKQLESSVPPEKRELLQRDWEGFVARHKTVMSMMERWKKGEWDPAQWGMDKDPIQMQKSPTTADHAPPDRPELAEKPAAIESSPDELGTPSPEGASPVVIANPDAAAVSDDVPSPVTLQWDPNDPATWHAYVRFIRDRYKFDAAQATTADSIHTELVERANAYLEKHRASLRKAPPGKRTNNPALEPVRQLFGELCDRLDWLPTSGQRENIAR